MREPVSRTSTRVAVSLISALLLLAACQPAPDPAAVLSVAIAGGDLLMAPGDSTTLTADVQLDGPGDTTVSWTSSVEAVATVDASGQLSALSPGTTEITATARADASRSDSIEVIVGSSGDVLATWQLGTADHERAWSTAVDADGYVYVAGHTIGALGGPNAGSLDAFVRRYSPSGQTVWTRQFGTPRRDDATAVAVDPAGNLFVAGETSGSMDGSMDTNQVDGFVRKYDPAGTVIWTRQFGTGEEETVHGAAADADGNVYVVGLTYGPLSGANRGSSDAYVRKYSPDGDHLWTRQFGTSMPDGAYDVAIGTGGTVIIVGSTSGTMSGPSAGSYDAYVRGYTPAGNLTLQRQFGTSGLDGARGVTVNQDGSIIVVGSTTGDLVPGASTGADDTFIRKYTAAGTHSWTRQFGTGRITFALAVAVDQDGGLYLAGSTFGALVGTELPVLTAAYVRAYSADGAVSWTRQFGSSGVASGADVAVHGGSVYVTGYVQLATLGDQSYGGEDAYIRRFVR